MRRLFLWLGAPAAVLRWEVRGDRLVCRRRKRWWATDEDAAVEVALQLNEVYAELRRRGVEAALAAPVLYEDWGAS